jgi:hypothetical protein
LFTKILDPRVFMFSSLPHQHEQAEQLGQHQPNRLVHRYANNARRRTSSSPHHPRVHRVSVNYPGLPARASVHQYCSQAHHVIGHHPRTHRVSVNSSRFRGSRVPVRRLAAVSRCQIKLTFFFVLLLSVTYIILVDFILFWSDLFFLYCSNVLSI